MFDTYTSCIHVAGWRSGGLTGARFKPEGLMTREVTKSMHTTFFADLTDWIEENLCNNLTMAGVAAQSGYSLWHLQRSFKKFTGVYLGSYIKSRKLTRAALELRMTDQPILDISLNCGFESQQTFTRSFKGFFGITPGVYRKMILWDFSDLCPKLQLTGEKKPVITVCELHEINISNAHSMNLSAHLNGKVFTVQYRNLIERLIRGAVINLRNKSVSVFSISVTGCSESECNVLHVSSVEVNLDGPRQNQQSLLTSPSGKYMVLSFTGEINLLSFRISEIYTKYLPELNVVRRGGDDIAILRRNENDAEKNMLKCDYLIPIVE